MAAEMDLIDLERSVDKKGFKWFSRNSRAGFMFFLFQYKV
jgi:hypothetical protein